MPLIRTVLRSAPTPAAAPAGPAVRRRAAALAVVAAAATLAACGGRDPFAPNPANNIDTQQTDFLVYPLSAVSGGPLATAVNLYTLTAVRPGLTIVSGGGGAVSAPNFDFAVDRAPDGRVRLVPSKLLVGLTGVGQPYTTGFQIAAAPFDSVTDAPTSGYQADSAITVASGQTVIVQSQSSVCPTYYGKALVVGVDAATGGITLRARINPNCGFRSLRPGRG